MPDDPAPPGTTSPTGPPVPERLRLPRHDPPARQRGHHKVYVGMAAGVGKTTRALNDLRDHLQAGEDALIGLLETHGRAGTIQAAEGLPVWPRQQVTRGTVTLGELDVQGLLTRRPALVLIDELAHTNVPGSDSALAGREKRWQDVQVLLDAGIHVLSTVNVQHLESLHDTVTRLTGVRVRERLPDSVLQDADELVLVDVTPTDLRARLLTGKIYSPDKIDQSLSHFFTTENLTALRELAMRQMANVVEEEAPTGLPGVKERVMVAVAAEDTSARLIRRGARIAERMGGDLLVVSVRPAHLTGPAARYLDTYRTLTHALGGTFTMLGGTSSVARALVTYARQEHVTQIVVGESSRSRLETFLRGDIIAFLLRETRNVDVYVISRD
ncbi:universal stress protein [Deinococcus aquiradiocola]|uniref:Sensor histidine kinase n=1 Tax=Deinococcus aquiradiocola TaxID=393059 RepID=A0A917UIG3_9DEIO|nr:universal stress protein [Deinococcus aquiradiocola]GGJ60734.1 sensor histidine kinase [Deinococcus aquiradiocola]